MVSPPLAFSSQILWSNAVKALLSKIWFECNQRVFHDKSLPWSAHLDSTRLLASTWCSLSKDFSNYSIQDISLNWNTYIFSIYVILSYICEFLFRLCFLYFEQYSFPYNNERSCFFFTHTTTTTTKIIIKIIIKIIKTKKKKKKLQRRVDHIRDRRASYKRNSPRCWWLKDD